MATEFTRHALHVRRRLAGKHLADCRRPGEGQLGNFRVGDELLADRCGVLRGHQVDDPLRDTGFFKDLKCLDGAERCGFCGLQHDGAAGGQCRADLARDHGDRIVPGRYRCDDADRLVHDNKPLIRSCRRDGLAVDAFCFFGEP